MEIKILLIGSLLFLTGCTSVTYHVNRSSAPVVSNATAIPQANYEAVVKEAEFCTNIDGQYPTWQAAFGPVSNIKDYGEYYEVTMNVVTDHFHEADQVTVPAIFRIKKDAKVIWWTGDSANETLTLDQYAEKYGADHFINSSMIRMWRNWDEDSSFLGVEQDENGYVTQLFDGEFN